MALKQDESIRYETMKKESSLKKPTKIVQD